MPGPEKKIQNGVRDWVEREYKDEIIVRKYPATRVGTNGWPDHEYLLPAGRIVFIEYKRPGGKCTDLQLHRHAQLRALGHTVHVCDSADTAKQILRLEMASARFVRRATS